MVKWGQIIKEWEKCVAYKESRIYCLKCIKTVDLKENYANWKIVAQVVEPSEGNLHSLSIFAFHYYNYLVQMFELYSTIFLLFLAIASPPCPAGYECPQGGGNIPCPEGTYSPSG